MRWRTARAKLLPDEGALARLQPPLGRVAEPLDAAAGFLRRLTRRGYDRLGPLYPPAVLLAALQTQYVVFLGAIGILAIYVRMSSGEAGLILAAGLIVEGLWNLTAARRSWRQLVPVREWIGGRRDADTTAQAWREAAALPQTYIRAQLLSPWPVALLLAWCLFATWLLGLPAYAIAILASAGCVVALYSVALMFLLGESAMVPVLEDIAAALPEDVDIELTGVSLRARMLVVLPAINVASGLAVAGLSASGGHATLRDLGIDTLIVLAVAMSVSLVLTMLLSRSIVGPIRALREATERVSAGKLDTRVAVISSDETGELARSFNRMVSLLQERERLREAFGAFVDPDLAERVASEGVDVAGEEVELSVMFVDVRGFTSFAESALPHEVVARLNDLYEHVVPVILSHGGHANKFIGDGLLAVFGVPERYPDHADRAVAAALEIARLVGERYAGEVRVGVGVNSGRAVAGTIGGGGRLDFTVIGDTVNTASRVESATRQTGDDVLISHATRQQLTRAFAGFDERPEITLKGKAEPIRLYAPRAPAAARGAAGANR
jgi:class 3 adenylate cyclase